MRKFFLLSLFFWALPFGLAAQDADQPEFFLITRSEMQSIEKFKAKSEAEKRNWQSQANAFKAELKGLKAESQNLNSQLAAQRELNKSLEMSYNESSQEKSRIISSQQSEIATLKSSNAKMKTNLVIAWCTAAILALLLAAMIFLKARKIFPP